MHLWSLASGVCVCLALGSTLFHAHTARQASACSCLMMDPALWKVRQPLLPCLNIVMAKGSSHPCTSSSFSISSTAVFPEHEMGLSPCILCPTEAVSRCPGRRKIGVCVEPSSASCTLSALGLLFPMPIQSGPQPAELLARTLPNCRELQRSQVWDNFLLLLPKPGSHHLH